MEYFFSPDQLEQESGHSIMPDSQLVLNTFPKGDNRWRKYLKDHELKQLWTSEAVSDLAGQIDQLVTQTICGEKKELYEESEPVERVQIVEVGAVDGMLAAALSEELNPLFFKKVIPTEERDWTNETRANSANFPVKNLTMDTALEQYSNEPNLVILSSWPEKGNDPVKQAFSHSNVKGLILIGDPNRSGQDRRSWQPSRLQANDFTSQIRGNFSISQENPHRPGNCHFVYITR